MSEHDDYARLVQQSRLNVLAPEVPNEDEVERVAARACAAASRPRRTTGTSIARLSVAAVIAVAVLAVATSLTPDKPAFARDRALAALMPPASEVLAFRVEVRAGGDSAGTVVDSTWIDASGGTWRTETRDSAGTVIGRRVANGDRALWTEESAAAIIEERVSAAPDAGLPVWLYNLRDLVALRDDRVSISQVEVGGERCWRLVNEKSYDDLVPFDALIAVADYRPKRVTIGGQGAAGDGQATWTVLEWRVVAADSLAPDFFSFDHVTRLKPEGTPIQRAGQ